jgi:diguanylate cyclase
MGRTRRVDLPLRQDVPVTTEPTASSGTRSRRLIATRLRWAVAPLLVASFCLLPTDSPVGEAAAAVGLGGVELLGLVLCARLGFDRRLSRRSRRAWRWMVVVFVVHVTVGASYGAAASTHGQQADAWILTAYGIRILLAPFLMAAAFSFRAPRRASDELGMLPLDMLMVAGSALLACWYFVVGPAVEHGFADTADVLALAIPLADVVLLAGASYVLISGVVNGAGTPLIHLTVGVLLLTVPDLYIARRASNDDLSPAVGPVLGLVIAGIYLMVLAGIHQIIDLRDRNETAPASGPITDARRLTFLPYVAVALGYVLLLLAAARSPFYPWGGLAVGTIVMTGGVVVRQVLQIRESRRLATTDHLTGLSNRAALRQGLERVQERAGRTGRPGAVMLFDLDGFKAVNDTLGHAAGDEALTAFGAVLRRNILGTDLVARLGGDEFAVVLTEVKGPQDAVVVAERILADLNEPVILSHSAPRLHTSIGIALIAGHEGPRDALHRADLAMYEAKRGSGCTWRVHVPVRIDTTHVGSLRAERRGEERWPDSY